MKNLNYITIQYMDIFYYRIYLFPFIDTIEFEKLRRIKNLGPVFFVFEGRIHTKFSHAIGVAYLANKMAKKIFKKFPKEGMTEKDIKLITIAGLLHDIGHGPFSHLFEQVVREIYKDAAYSHENVSCLLIDRMQEKYKLFDSNEDVEMVKNIILGIIPKGEKRFFIYEIVSNPTTSIDVDKF